MRIHEVVGMIREYFYLGLIGVIILGILGAVGYFLIYRKLLGGKRKFTIKEILLGFAFTGYIIMVMGVTFLGRGDHFKGSVNLHFLSSYIDAWNSFSLKGWQQLIFNIIMFAPLGILLPLINERFHKIKWTIGVALGFTIIIETIQLITGFGVFELDDMFNNVLGALIGYGLIMAIITIFKLRTHEYTNIIIYLSPLILIIGVFTSLFTYYNLKEFGNISIAYNYKMNMKNVKVSLNEELNTERLVVPIYKAPIYGKDTGKEFATSFFENIGVDASGMEINQYNENALYWVRGNPSYNIWLNYRDGSYTYHDFSSFDDDVEIISTDKENLLEKLDNFNIDISAKAIFNQTDRDGYEWNIEREIVANTLTEGFISCSYYSDGTIKEISNKLVTYNKVKDISIKSEKEAYEELLDGKFSYFNLGKGIGSIDITGAKLDYYLDSKGYYQPVYSFDSIIDGEEFKITIPAL